MNCVGALIYQRRCKKQITQRKFAKKLGISAQFIGLVEKGRVGLPQKHWPKVIKMLDIEAGLLRDCLITDYEGFLREVLK